MMQANQNVGGGGGAPPGPKVKKPLNQVLKELLKKFRRKDRGHIFWEAVPKTVPGYYEAVKHPMDFSLMELKMKKLRYSTLDDFVADFLLICHNCKFFNNEASEYWETADMMEHYGLEAIESARDSVDTSVPPGAKYQPQQAEEEPQQPQPQSSRPSTSFMLPLTNTPNPMRENYYSNNNLVAAVQQANQGNNYQGGGYSNNPPQMNTIKPGNRAIQIAQSSSLFEINSNAQQNVFNPNLYPIIPPQMIATGSFTHPTSLPESVNYWQAAPYPAYHPQSGLGQAQAHAMSNTSLQQHSSSKNKHRNQYTKAPPIGRPKRDIRLISGPGIENNFGLGLYPTPMDWVTIWEREQEVWKQTGKNSLTREEQDGYNSLGPLSYADYKPSSHLNFDQRYLDRIQKFVRHGLIGDAAAIHPGTTPTPNLNTGSTTNVYSHLLKESGVHKALQAKIDSIVVDTSVQLKPSSKDYIPTPFASSLPKTYPIALKPGEPMGISLSDVTNIKSLMGELEIIMKQAFTLKQQQAQQAKAAAAMPTPAAATPTGETGTPMEIDTPTVKAEGGVKTEPGVKSEAVKQEEEADVKREPTVKLEPGTTPMDTSENVKVEPSPTAAASLPVFNPPSPISLLPILPTSRIVDCSIQLVNPASGSCDTCVRMRFAPIATAPNFNAEFLAQSLSQADILALRGMVGMGERMIDWHRVKQKMIQAQVQQQALKQQQAAQQAQQQQNAQLLQQQQQQQLQQQQQASLQQPPLPTTSLQQPPPPTSSLQAPVTGKHQAPPMVDEPQAKRIKTEPSPVASVGPVGISPSNVPLTQQQLQMQLLARQQQSLLQQQQLQPQQHPSSRSSQQPPSVQSRSSTSTTPPAGLTPEDQERWLQQMKMREQMKLQQQQSMQQQSLQQQQQQQQQQLQLSIQTTAPPAPSSSASSLQAGVSSPSPATSAAPNVPSTGGPSSLPTFDRSRLIPGLRNLNNTILDRLIALNYIAPNGTILVDTNTIIQTLQQLAQQHQQQKATAAASGQTTGNTQ